MQVEAYKKAIKICMKAKVPLMAWGPGGVGKTRGSEQVAAEMGVGWEHFPATQKSLVDITGLPDRDGIYTTYLRPRWLPENGNGIILWDELPDASLEMKKMMYHAILENKCHTHKIPEGWYQMGAGNRPEDFGYSGPMPGPLITRFTHIGVGCEPPDFDKFTTKSAEIDIMASIPYMTKVFHPIVIAFLKMKEEFIYNHQACPRTWENTSKLMLSDTDWNNYIFQQLVRGTVGQAIGDEFNAFVKIVSKIPNIDMIITKPESAPISDRRDITFTLTTTLLKRLNSKTATNIVTYIERLPQEFQFFFFHMVGKEKPEIIANPKYLNWRNKNQQFLI